MMKLQKALEVSLFLIAGILETAGCMFGFLVGNLILINLSVFIVKAATLKVLGCAIGQCLNGMT
jgi:hypothetical protein